ncbi:hypothetical protein VCV18_008153 [Metarhizium anisopliae]
MGPVRAATESDWLSSLGFAFSDVADASEEFGIHGVKVLVEDYPLLQASLDSICSGDEHISLLWPLVWVPEAWVPSHSIRVYRATESDNEDE